MKSKVILLILVVFSFASCKTVKMGSSKSLDVLGAGVIQLPVVAELDVSSKKASFTQTFSNSSSSTDTKNEVIRSLLKQYNADVLIEPIFESITQGTKTTLTVSGYPATYKNMRTIEQRDLDLIEIDPTFIQKTQENVSVTEAKGKSKKK